MSHIKNHTISSPLMLPAKLQVLNKEMPISVFIDSRADTEFIDYNFAKSLDIKLVPLTKPHGVLALDGHTLHKTSQETEPITLRLGGNHHEETKFIVINSSHLPIILGVTWL